MQIGRGYSLNLKLGMYGPRLNQNHNINMINSPIKNLARISYDKIEISKNARNLYLDSIVKENSGATFNRANVKIETQNNGFEYKNLEKEFTDMSLKYKKSIDKIKSLDLSDKEKKNRIEGIKKSYTKEMQTSIDEIADEFDEYFDKGHELLQKYSKDELEDIFDVDKFKKNFKSKALKLVDAVANSTNQQGSKQIYNAVVRNSKEALELENMNFEEITILHKSINDKDYDTGLEADDKVTLGTNIALKENNKNKFIDLLPLGENIKEAMYKIHGRISEGKMRNEAYQEELQKHDEKIKAFNEKLAYIAKKIDRVEKVVKRRGEDYGVIPKNKLLLNSLKDESKILSKYGVVKKEKEELEDDFRKLSLNKSKIVNFDSYKRMKAYYNETKEVKEKDNELYPLASKIM